MFLFKVCQALENADVPYAVVGGYAVALHGAVRGTVDVDIVVKWTFENLQKAEKAMRDIGLVSTLPITAKNIFDFKKEYIENRNLIAWNFHNPSNPVQQVGLIISYDLQDASTDLIQTPFGKIKILSRKDLIAMKKKSGRPQDLEDIRALGEI